jgi:hypothetical protein
MWHKEIRDPLLARFREFPEDFADGIYSLLVTKLKLADRIWFFSLILPNLILSNLLEELADRIDRVCLVRCRVFLFFSGEGEVPVEFISFVWKKYLYDHLHDDDDDDDFS